MVTVLKWFIAYFQLSFIYMLFGGINNVLKMVKYEILW